MHRDDDHPSLGAALSGGPAAVLLSLVVTASASAGRCFLCRSFAATILGAVPPVRLMLVTIAIAALAIPALHHHPRLAVLELELILRAGQHLAQHPAHMQFAS